MSFSDGRRTGIRRLGFERDDVFTRDRAYRRKSQGADVAFCALAIGEEKTRSSHVRQNGTLAIERLRPAIAFR